MSSGNAHDNEAFIPFLSLVREIAADAAAQPDPDTCFRHLRAGLIRLGFNRASVWVTNSDDPTRSRGTWGTGWEGEEIDEHDLTQPIGEKLGYGLLETGERVYLGRVARPADPLASADQSVDSTAPQIRRRYHYEPMASASKSSSSTCFPSDRTIDREHLAALELVADVVAVAVARGRIVDSLRVTNEELHSAVAASREAEEPGIELFLNSGQTTPMSCGSAPMELWKPNGSRTRSSA